MAVCAPDFEWVPPADWPESAPVRTPEAAWEFLIEIDSAWARGEYVLVEVVDDGGDVIAGRLTRHMRGKASGVEADFEYWIVIVFRDGRQARYEWFRGREEALDAAGLSA
jgi:ketosteroid isomerase-like protein